MFKQMDGQRNGEAVRIIVDGVEREVFTGMSVAAALLAMGEIEARISPSSQKPCSPHCLMGVCFECLMEIDGIERQACMVEVRDGLVINRNLGKQQGENR